MKNIITNQTSSTKGNKLKYFLTLSCVFFGFSAIAQNTQSSIDSSDLSLFTNPLFNALLGIIILLIIVIAILAGVLKSVAEVSVRKKSNTGTMAGVITVLLFISSQSIKAQSASDMAALAAYTELPNTVLFYMLFIITFEILIIAVLINAIKIFTRKEISTTAIEDPQPTFFEIINASVAIEKEEDIILDHNYDGIRELDNDLPPWWKYGFYFTILVSVIYIFNYHVIGGGHLQNDEYNASMYMAKIAKEEYQKMNANNVNESSVTMLTDKAEIAKGETMYKENCFACHGKLGEGGVGPNLTDEYWLHGGSIKDIFISLKYGWPDKGMKSWQADFSPIQIHQIASYVKTLNGSNPANPKVPQGDLYKEVLIAGDSVKTDNTKVSNADSLKIVIQ